MHSFWSVKGGRRKDLQSVGESYESSLIFENDWEPPGAPRQGWTRGEQIGVYPWSGASRGESLEAPLQGYTPICSPRVHPRHKLLEQSLLRNVAYKRYSSKIRDDS